MNAAIRCEGVGKRYRLRTSGRILYRTLRDDFMHLLGRVNPFRVTEQGDEFIWALQDVSLDIARGEALGIIGSNGSGKTTLLKLLAGVTSPTRGMVEVHGRIGPLIEVGAGIHPELTGRENIYLYGVIIGLNRQEILRKFDSIVAFSELENFLDVPVKRYSSGMRIRLGFAIASHVDPDILLVDEVLAVGDAAFQRKCLEKIKGMLDSGVTILYVSHELSSLERLCPRALWLDHGTIRQVGPSTDVVSAYLKDVETRRASRTAVTVRSPGGFALEGVSLTDAVGREKALVQTGDALTVSLSFRCPEEFVATQLALKVLDDRMTTVAMAIWANGETAGEWRSGRGTIRCTFESLPLSPRLYQVWVQVLRHPDYREEVPWTLLTSFSVIDGRHGGDRSAVLPPGREAPVIVVPTTWQLDSDPVVTLAGDRLT